MTSFKPWVSLCLLLSVAEMSARAEDKFCRDVEGRIVWTLLGIGPQSLAPTDPAGRVLGSISGTFTGATTAIIREAVQNPDGSTSTKDLDVFVLGPGDLLWGQAEAKFTPIQGRPAIQDTQRITILGGTGKYAGASGTLEINGEGAFVDPKAGQVAGNLIFDVDYKGTVCKTTWDEGWWFQGAVVPQ